MDTDEALQEIAEEIAINVAQNYICGIAGAFFFFLALPHLFLFSALPIMFKIFAFIFYFVLF